MIPTLLPYQADWVGDDAGLAAIEKSRRIGASWSEAYGSVMYAGEGRGNVNYQSYGLEMARGFIEDCADWAKDLNVAAGAVGETLIHLGKKERESVQAYRIRMASGFTITALASSPRAWRSKGRPGDIGILDEAAFVDDLREVLKAMMATRIWGGRVRVISTHNGESNPFNRLCRDVREGVRPGSLHSVTFKDAIAQGLYKRICRTTGQVWTAEAEREWEAAVRAEYGSDAAEELDCIPSAGGGAWLAWHLLRAAEHADANRAELFAGGHTFIGVDVARRKDLWVAAVVELVGDVLWLRELVVEQNIPFSMQHDIVADLKRRYRPLRIAIDQTGMGEEFVETEKERHGENLVEGVIMTAPRRLDVATALREAFEDRRIRIHEETAMRNDLHSIKRDAGATGAPRLLADGENTDGHADRFWALALAVSASNMTPFRAGYRPVARETVEEREDRDSGGSGRVYAQRGGGRRWVPRGPRRRRRRRTAARGGRIVRRLARAA